MCDALGGQDVRLYVSAPLDLGMWMRDALGHQVERRAVEERSSGQRDRSHLLRNRLHQASCESRAAWALGCAHRCRGGCSTLSLPWVGR